MRDYLKNIPDLAAGYHMDREAGTLVSDFSPNGNHGTMIGGTRTKGQIDYAVKLDGIDDRINCGYDPSLDCVAGLTLEAFIHPTKDAVTQFIFCRGWRHPYSIFKNAANNKLGCGLTFSNDTLTYKYGDTPLATDIVLHVAITFTPATGILQFYLNGDPDGTDAVLALPLKVYTTILELGGLGA